MKIDSEVIFSKEKRDEMELRYRMEVYLIESEDAHGNFSVDHITNYVDKLKEALATAEQEVKEAHDYIEAMEGLHE